MDNTLSELRLYIKNTGGVPQFAAACDVEPPTVYGWLNGWRSILPHQAEKIEIITKRKFKKERLVFAKLPVKKAANRSG